ncbi:MAG: ABC transporter ATP-binding protein [Acidimicrobiales bacterium]
MDEPLSNLDAALRTQTRSDIVEPLRALGTTTLYVSHDQVEAMTMGHRIAVMNSGALQQVAPPENLYRLPANRFVAAFIGTPGMNLPAGRLSGDPPALELVTGRIALSDSKLLGCLGSHDAVIVGWRPEAARIDPAGTLGAKVKVTEILGADVLVVCTLGSERIVLRQGSGQPRPAPGESIRFTVDQGDIHLRCANRIAPRSGRTRRLLTPPLWSCYHPRSRARGSRLVEQVRRPSDTTRPSRGPLAPGVPNSSKELKRA